MLALSHTFLLTRTHTAVNLPGRLLLGGSDQITEIMQQTGISYTVTTVTCPDEQIDNGANV